MAPRILFFFSLLALCIGITSSLAYEVREAYNVNPSFDCNDSPSPFEKHICLGEGQYWETIRILDFYMEDLYQHAIAKSELPDQVVDRQRAWISARDKYYEKDFELEYYFGPHIPGMECGEQGHLACYSNRISQLWGEIKQTIDKKQIRDIMLEKYIEILGWNDPPKGRANAYLYQKRAEFDVNMLGNSEYMCAKFDESLIFHEPPKMVSKSIYSRTCGGPYAKVHLTLYCDTGSDFVEVKRAPLSRWTDTSEESVALQTLLSNSPCEKVLEF